MWWNREEKNEQNTFVDDQNENWHVIFRSMQKSQGISCQIDWSGISFQVYIITCSTTTRIWNE